MKVYLFVIIALLLGIGDAYPLSFNTFMRDMTTNQVGLSSMILFSFLVLLGQLHKSNPNAEAFKSMIDENLEVKNCEIIKKKIRRTSAPKYRKRKTAGRSSQENSTNLCGEQEPLFASGKIQKKEEGKKISK